MSNTEQRQIEAYIPEFNKWFPAEQEQVFMSNCLTVYVGNKTLVLGPAGFFLTRQARNPIN